MGDVIVIVGEVVSVVPPVIVMIYPIPAGVLVFASVGIGTELFNRISLPEIVTSELPSPDSIK